MIISFIKNIIGISSNDLSIDLGTANTLIYVKGEGIVLNEPSVVSIRKDKIGTNKSIAAIGKLAKKMLGRTPGNIITVKPLKDGVIADFFITEKMLQFFIKQINKNKFIKSNPRVLISVPVGATQVERRAIRESAYGAGSRDVFIIEEPMAAAIGAGLPVSEASGSMVVDIGGGTTEVAIISLNGIVYSSSIRTGGNRFDEFIINYIKKKYGLLIGETTSEKIKKKIGSAFIDNKSLEYEITGRKISEGIPRKIKIKSEEILESLNEPLINIINSIMLALENCPPELLSDIFEKGMILTGGGALLKNIDKLIFKHTGIPVIIADDPLTCVARGGGKALEMIDINNEIFNEE